MGFSPYYLMYGRHPLLPINIKFNITTPYVSTSSTHKYVDKLQSGLQWAYKRAKEINNKERDRYKRQFDKKVRSSALETGDLFLVHQKRIRGKEKISNCWGEYPLQNCKHHEETSCVQITHTGKRLHVNKSPALELALPNWMCRPSRWGNSGSVGPRGHWHR